MDIKAQIDRARVEVDQEKMAATTKLEVAIVKAE